MAVGFEDIRDSISQSQVNQENYNLAWSWLINKKNKKNHISKMHQHDEQNNFYIILSQ